MTSLDPSYIWDSYNLDELNNQLIFEKETLSFTLLNVNFDEIEKIHAHLKESSDPFVKKPYSMVPFTSSIPTIQTQANKLYIRRVYISRMSKR